MMRIPSILIADWLVPSKWKRWQHLLTGDALGGLVMTSWDLIMDPVMVAGGSWIWDA